MNPVNVVKKITNKQLVAVTLMHASAQNNALVAIVAPIQIAASKPRYQRFFAKNLRMIAGGFLSLFFKNNFYQCDVTTHSHVT